MTRYLKPCWSPRCFRQKADRRSHPSDTGNAAREQGVHVVFLYNLYPKSVFGLMVKDDVSYQTPVDLKGQVIGVGTADSAEVAFGPTIVGDLGLSQGTDYAFLPVGDGDAAAVASMRDEIEAYAIAVSDAAILASRGLQLREITPEQYLGFFSNGFAALRATIDEQPDVIPPVFARTDPPSGRL
jgi:NitT/TauT family transport system substrate-binding protein